MKLADLPIGDQRAHDLIDRSLGEPDSRRAIRRLLHALRYGHNSLQAKNAFQGLGERYERLGNLPRSIWYYSRALELAEDDANTRCWRGQVYYQHGDWDAARTDLEEALGSDDMELAAEDREIAEQYLRELRRRSH